MASILIADDVAMARDALARALRERGHRVTVVADGQEAVERFQRERPEVVILDVMMPRLGGLEACARIKQASSGLVPAIIISARTDLDTRLQALSVAEDYVPKPYEALELCARVEAHLRTRRLVEDALGSAAAPAPGAGRSADEVAAVPQAVPELRTGRAAKSGTLFPRLLDRDTFVERLVEEWKRAARSNEPLALVVAGADGEVTPGDPPVTTLLGGMQRSLRVQDLIARVDEAHAAGLLINTHMTGSMAVAERLRRELRRMSMTNGMPMVVSMGFTFFPSRDVTEPTDMLKLAERAIARAREDGPGRICLWQHQGYLFEPPE